MDQFSGNTVFGGSNGFPGAQISSFHFGPIPEAPSFEVIFESLHDDVEVPKRATQGSAGHDLKAYLKGKTITIYTSENLEQKFIVGNNDTVTLLPLDRAVIPCGFKAKVPADTKALVSLRSGIGLKKGLIMPNSPGVIDEDYPGEWGILVLNVSSVPVTITHGERLAQTYIDFYETPDWVEAKVEVTTDRTGGYGSTGK
jgi:dUTP pyrophosphatase